MLPLAQSHLPPCFPCSGGPCPFKPGVGEALPPSRRLLSSTCSNVWHTTNCCQPSSLSPSQSVALPFSARQQSLPMLFLVLLYCLRVSQLSLPCLSSNVSSTRSWSLSFPAPLVLSWTPVTTPNWSSSSRLLLRSFSTLQPSSFCNICLLMACPYPKLLKSTHFAEITVRSSS